MSFSCFPVSMQAGYTNNEPNNRFELDLVTEVANTIVDFASRLKRKTARIATRPVATITLDQLTEQQRINLAANPNTDAAALAQLSRDANAFVRTEVIFNPATPAATLQELAFDADRFVAAQARERLSVAA